MHDKHCEHAAKITEQELHDTMVIWSDIDDGDGLRLEDVGRLVDRMAGAGLNVDGLEAELEHARQSAEEAPGDAMSSRARTLEMRIEWLDRILADSTISVSDKFQYIQMYHAAVEAHDDLMETVVVPE